MIVSKRFGSQPGQLRATAGEYRLVVSATCPWCRRVAIARRLLGLQDAIAVSESVESSADGFVFETPGYSFETNLRVRTARELYRRQADWQIGDPTTVPVLIDSNGTIVANSSSDLLLDFIEQWREHQKISRDFYPEDERPCLDELDDFIDNTIGKAAFGVLRAEPDGLIEALAHLDKALAWAENRLEDQGFIAADMPRESDIRMFTHVSSLWKLHVSEEQMSQARALAADMPDFEPGCQTGGPASRAAEEDDAPCAIIEFAQHRAARIAAQGESEDEGGEELCSVVSHTAFATQASSPVELPAPAAQEAQACGVAPVQAPGACGVGGAASGAASEQDANAPHLLTYWPHVFDWWATLSGAPGWVSPTERRLLEIPPVSQLLKR